MPVVGKKTQLQFVKEEISSLFDCKESLSERVELLNDLRHHLHRFSPFKSEPVDFVKWVSNEVVVGNTYNPNSVAPPEMRLLERSIDLDGYTQPIVSWPRDNSIEVVDGFHRYRVGKESKFIESRVRGYLPVVVIKNTQEGVNDRMASTIRHNRARGKHQVESMAEIVVELKRRNWSDKRIGKELGMDDDEVLRLTQITGLAEMFSNSEFSEAWEHEGQVDADVDEDEEGNVNLEWMKGGIKKVRDPGWHDRTEQSSVLYNTTSRQLGTIQKSRFNDEWFWYAFAQPMEEGRCPSLEKAKEAVETRMEV